jgi:hypothetical protein
LAVLSIRWTETATACALLLTPEQRREMIRIIAKIQINPWIDPPVKINVPALGAMYILYSGPRDHWVLYHVDSPIVTLVGMGVGDPYVPLPRSD